MNQEKFELFLKETNHTEKSIKSRISRLKKIEDLFQLDVDDIIYDEIKITTLLHKLKAQNLDTTNQNLANALRCYYKCITGKIFKKESSSIKKKCFLLLCFPFILSPYTACNSNEKIQLINSKTYGIIKPIDIYTITDGYMSTSGEISQRKKYSLNIPYEYCAYEYLDQKQSSIINNTSLLEIDQNELKVSWGYSDFFGTKVLTYYSQFWGNKEDVLFIADIVFKETYYINFIEKSDTYKITYYDIDNETGLHEVKSINNYKKTIEIPKIDVTKIEYF